MERELRNGERMRKWREHEEIKRDSLSTFPHFLLFSSLSIHLSKIVSFCRKMLQTALCRECHKKLNIRATRKLVEFTARKLRKLCGPALRYVWPIYWTKVKGCKWLQSLSSVTKDHNQRYFYKIYLIDRDKYRISRSQKALIMLIHFVQEWKVLLFLLSLLIMYTFFFWEAS